MASELPEYYFRVRENGGIMFRIETENRQRRIEMEQLATINVRTGDVRPSGETVLTEADLAAVQTWLDERIQILAMRDLDDIHRAVDYLNITTQWVQAKATDQQLENVTDALLLAMHDLRNMLVRKRADRLLQDND